MVTRPGGLGLGLAVAPRGTVRVFSASSPGPEALSNGSSLRIRSFMNSTSSREWPITADPFVSVVVQSVLEERRLPDGTHWVMELDTRPFFDRTGRHKKGLGSSAVATVLIVAALLELTGTDPSAEPDVLLSLAITAHRNAHGGRGSGYDVATSACGGAVLFTGGSVPGAIQSTMVERWGELGLSFYGWNGNHPVASSKAVALFDRHLPPESEEGQALALQSNELVTQLNTAPGWTEIFGIVSQIARLGLTLGDRIGVSAVLPFVSCHHDDGWISKASGAGNERAIIVARSNNRRPLPPEVQLLNPEREGLRRGL